MRIGKEFNDCRKPMGIVRDCAGSPNPSRSWWHGRRVNEICRCLSFFSLLTALTIFLNFFTVPLYAGDWKLIPKIGLYGGYDDNILFTRENKFDSTIINIQPAVEFGYFTLLSEMHIEADWDILRYLDESDLDRVNQDYKLDWWRQLGERWKTRAGARYRFDSTQNSYLEDTGRLIEILDRENLQANFGVNYALTTVSSIDTEYKYQKAKYEDDRYPNYSRHRLNFYYRHRLKSERDFLLIGPSFYHRINDLNDTDYASIDLGWERNWSEITTSFAGIGARYTTVKLDSGEEKSDWGVKARVNLDREGVVSKITFRYFHDLRTTAEGEDVNVDNFFLQYHYLITQRFGLGIDGRLVLSYNLFKEDRDTDNTRYYEIRPYLNYWMVKRLNMYIRYSYQNSSQDLFENDDIRERNRIWVEFQYAFNSLI